MKLNPPLSLPLSLSTTSNIFCKTVKKKPYLWIMKKLEEGFLQFPIQVIINIGIILPTPTMVFHTNFRSDNSCNAMVCTDLIAIAYYCSFLPSTLSIPTMAETHHEFAEVQERDEDQIRLLFGKWPCVIPKPLTCRTIQ